MAVPEQTPYIEHIANGVTTSFALGFECKDKEHLIVLVDNVEPNVGTWSLVNGSVVFGTAPVNGKIISIQRNTPFRRDTNFQSYDNSLRPATINKDFDWIWYKLQELGVADWILGNRIDALKNYVDDRDDELRAYLMEEIRKQGVALDQLDEYYNYLMERLAQIAVDKGWDASFVVDGDENQHQINNTTVRNVESIADLIAINNPKGRQVIYVKSYHTGLNKGGDNFVFNSTRSSENDGISVFNGWERLWSADYVTFYHAGAVGDYVTDDEVAIEMAQQYARDNGKQVFIAGNFAKSKPFVVRSGDYVTGSRLASRIKKISNATSGLPAILAPEKDNVYDIYDVDALCIFLPWSGYYADHITLRDVMFIRGTYGVDNASDYGLYAPRHSSCETLNLKFDNVLGGFFAKNLFLNRHVDFESVGQSSEGIHASNIGMQIFDGDNIQTGTSNTFERFLFVNYRQAYYISGLQTSNFLCCYGEAISKNGGNDDTQIFTVYNPQELSFENCGLEGCYGSPLYIVNTNTSIRGKISIKGWQSRWGANGTLVDRGINLLTALGNVDVVVESSTFHKANEGYINDFGYISNSAKLINIGSKIGSSVVSASGASYINVENMMLDGDGGVVKSSKPVGNDLNNGAEDKAGMVIKQVNGATLNLPSGLTDAWGVSQYFGANASEGVQIFMSTTSDAVYKRRRTGISSFTGWTLL